MNDPRTAVERSILVTFGNAIDEDRLCDDPNSFIEMDQGVIHIASSKYGDRYFRVTLTETDHSHYFDSIHFDSNGNPAL